MSSFRNMHQRAALIVACMLLGARVTAAQVVSQQSIQPNDPRVGLRGGWGTDAAVAIKNLEFIANVPRPEGFFNREKPGDEAFMNSDLAFVGNLLFLGNFSGWTVWDIANPARPTLRKSYLCPGGQGDVTVYKNLLFMSAEETRGGSIAARRERRIR